MADGRQPASHPSYRPDREIIVEARRVFQRLDDLSRAIETNNILLARSICSDVRARVRIIKEIANDAQRTLEDAPAE